MGKKILTLDNLYQFFVSQGKNFNFNDNKSPIVVSVPGNFKAIDNDMPGMLKLKLKVCHTETNRNGSHISNSNMEKAMPTLKYRPILAHIHQLDDGTKDFYAHNIEIVENEDGEEEVVYVEKQVGCFTADEPWLEYDEEMDKTYVMAYGVIPEEYTDAADIIRRKNGTKVSCELVINELAYNAKEKYLDLIDFYFGGTTLLGSDEDGNEIGEGMLGARADISDFCYKEPVFTYQEKLIEVLDKLNITLSNFNINQSEEEGGDEEMNKFEELLAQYNKTAEEITFEVEGLTDEELEAKFKEAFEETEEVETETEAETETEEVDVEVEAEVETEEVETVTEEEETVIENSSESDDGDETPVDEKFTKTFSVEISHDDIRCALYGLIGVYEEEDNEWYGIYEVYDSYFVMQGWINGKFYKQGYQVDGENVFLSGDRQEMFMMLLSESEKLEIESMRKDYSALKEFKNNYDASQLKAQKDEVLSREEYSEIAESNEFKALAADVDNYSVEELEVKCDLLFAAHAKAKHKSFATTNSGKKPTAMVFSVSTVDETNKKPYGDLF